MSEYIERMAATQAVMEAVDDGLATTSEDLREILEDLPAADVAPVWISVKDKLPENEDLVLAVISGSYGNIRFVDAVVLGNYYEDGWEIEDYPDPGWEGLEVRCWMPLPEPPEED